MTAARKQERVVATVLPTGRQAHMDRYLAELLRECLPRRLSLGALQESTALLARTICEDVRVGLESLTPETVRDEIVGRVGAALAHKGAGWLAAWFRGRRAG